MSATKKVPVDLACKNCLPAALAAHYTDQYVKDLLGIIADRTGGDIKLHDHGILPVTVIWHWQPKAVEYRCTEYGYTIREALEKVVEFLDDFERETKKK
jgi:hypothetical protein